MFCPNVRLKYDSDPVWELCPHTVLPSSLCDSDCKPRWKRIQSHHPVRSARNLTIKQDSLLINSVSNQICHQGSSIFLCVTMCHRKSNELSELVLTCKRNSGHVLGFKVTEKYFGVPQMLRLTLS